VILVSKVALQFDPPLPPVNDVCNTVNINSCFRYEGKTRKELNLVIFKNIPRSNYINGELSTRPYRDTFVDRVISIITKLLSPPFSTSYLKRVWELS